jgi:hypothetical protein
MADLIIPPPDAAGYFHFLYRTTDPETGEWYGGKRSTKKHPLIDRYLGSGNWIRAHSARERLTRKIVAFYLSSAEVYAAEAEMITLAVVFSDPLCMNKSAGGVGMTIESWANPKIRLKMLAALHLKHADPKWQENNRAALRRITADPAWRAAYDVGMVRKIANPAWQEAQSDRAKKMMADPGYPAATAAGLKKRSADPAWQANQVAGAGKRSENPKWVASQAASARNRSEDPAWSAAAKIRWSNPVYRENAISGMLRTHAKPEVSAAKSVVTKLLWENPESRARKMAGILRYHAQKRAAKASGSS